jgi:hypothetical protein
VQQEEDIEDAEGASHTAVYIMTRSALVNNSENEKRVLVSSLQNVQYLGDRNIKRILTLSGLIFHFLFSEARPKKHILCAFAIYDRPTFKNVCAVSPLKGFLFAPRFTSYSAKQFLSRESKYRKRYQFPISSLCRQI